MTALHFHPDELPNFKEYLDASAAQIEAKLVAILDQNRKQLSTLLAQPAPLTWDNFMQAFEEMHDSVHHYWSALAHLHGVAENSTLREAYHLGLTHLTAYQTALSQNEALYHAMSSIAAHPNFKKLNPAQQKIIQNDLRDFKLAGIHLPADKKARFSALQQSLNKAMTQFSEHVLDATHAFYLHRTDPAAVIGLPSSVVQLLEQNAQSRQLPGYVFTLDYPCYSTVLKYSQDPVIRKTLYDAYVTRASECATEFKQFDNTALIEEILAIRHEIAHLVGFPHYAEYSLATKMAKTPESVLEFLNELLDKSKKIAKKEYQALLDFAQQKDHLTELKPWDIAYYSEALREASFKFTQEDLRPYFPINQVLEGMFAVVQKLFGIYIHLQPDVQTWHPQVQFYELFDAHHTLIGGFYIDLYARPHKREGAWMDDCQTRHRLANGTLMLPIAFLTCNFMQPLDAQVALLTHDDVLTLFHEFGHCLHHLLTKVDYSSVAGINGVLWDAVEFPSQFLELFCWEKSVLDLIARHYQSGAALPEDLFKKMIAAKHFQSGLHMLRQLEFSLFDFRLHLEYQPGLNNQALTLYQQIRAETAVIPAPDYARFPHTFSHIFAGSYAAGYYSYKWAEVLSADAFALFQEQGILSSAIGALFLKHILEVGGVPDPLEAFITFRGRTPKIEALLQHNGMIVQD